MIEGFWRHLLSASLPVRPLAPARMNFIPDYSAEGLKSMGE